MAREDNNLFVKPPFGDAQILRWQGIELILDQCSFNPDGGIGPIGYNRFQNVATLAKINQYTIFGSNPITSPLFSEKFAFEWSLILDQDKWYILEAILRGQQRNIQTRQAAADIQVELLDARKLLLEPSARDRAQCSEAPAAAEAAAPGGFDIFYPKFYILLSVSQDQITWLLDPDLTTSFVEFRMVGLELDKVPTSEDENIKLIP